MKVIMHDGSVQELSFEDEAGRGALRHTALADDQFYRHKRIQRHRNPSLYLCSHIILHNITESSDFITKDVLFCNRRKPGIGSVKANQFRFLSVK